MNLIRHCIIDKNTNKVVNIIDYDVEKNHPDGFDDNYFCVADNEGQIGGNYENGVITNLPNPVVFKVISNTPLPTDE